MSILSSTKTGKAAITISVDKLLNKGYIRLKFTNDIDKFALNSISSLYSVYYEIKSNTFFININYYAPNNPYPLNRKIQIETFEHLELANKYRREYNNNYCMLEAFFNEDLYKLALQVINYKKQ
jgi:hypothetical protein